MLTRREVSAGIAAATLALSARDVAHAEDAAARQLPAPRSSGGMPLIDALKLRRSTRAYSERPLEPQVLSDLLWAANGVNRPSGDRTAPYWRHIMVIDIYAAMADGVWLYDPKAHALVPHMTDVGPEERRLFASADACFIGQNVYLFCASEGLATVFRGSANQTRLGAAMNLPDGQFVTFAQTVGYSRA